MNEISEDSSKVNTKEPEMKRAHTDHIRMYKGVVLASFMIDERLKEPDCKDDE